MDPSTDADLSALTGSGPEPGAIVTAAIRTGCWWAMAAATVALGARLRHSSARGGWQLWRLLLGVLIAMAVNATVYSAELAAFSATKDAYAGAVPALHRTHIFTSNAADACFIAVLMLLASGYCVTKSFVPKDRRAYVYGVPVVLFVSGIVTDYGFYELSSAEASNEDDFSSFSRGDATFWFFSTLVNLGALLLAWVFVFDILEQEADALRAQELANVPREREAADRAAAASHAHAAAPEYLDQGALPPGTVAFKPLPATGGGGGAGAGRAAAGGGAGNGASASAAAADDEEAQLEAEFRDVMDRLRFEVKKKLLRRLSTGVAVYLVASTAALLLPLFVLGAVQVAVLSLKFFVEAAFVGWLVWIFRPVEDSPYLLVGGTAEETEAMGADLGTDLGAAAQAAAAGRQQGGGGGGAAGGGEEEEEEDWGSAAVAARLEMQQREQQQREQQLPVSRAMGSTEARFSLGGEEELPKVAAAAVAAPPAPPPLAPPPPPPPPPAPVATGAVVASTSRGGSPVSTPTRRRPSGAGGVGGPAFADVKLD